MMVLFTALLLTSIPDENDIIYDGPHLCLESKSLANSDEKLEIKQEITFEEKVIILEKSDAREIVLRSIDEKLYRFDKDRVIKKDKK